MKRDIRVFIVDDEFITLDLLRTYMDEMGYRVVGDAMNAEEALEVLRETSPDIALLDINLGGEKDGVWLGGEIRKKYNIPIIYITAYDDPNTIRNAAETLPSAYLVKPFKKVDLYPAIEIALKNYSKQNQPTPTDSDEHNDPDVGLLHDSQSIFIKNNSVYKKIYFSDIRYIQAFKNYLELHLSDQREVIRYTLKGFLNLVSDGNFLQVHRSYVVNLNHVNKVDSHEVQVEDAQIPVSRSNRDELLAKLKLPDSSAQN
ncbi:MAG: response regulator [Bacteroidetes bacterium]|nr:response regulator [Bacteroidota bacterium]